MKTTLNLEAFERTLYYCSKAENSLLP